MSASDDVGAMTDTVKVGMGVAIRVRVLAGRRQWTMLRSCRVASGMEGQQSRELQSVVERDE